MSEDELNTKTEAYYDARREYDLAKSISNAKAFTWRQKEQELVDYMIEHQLKKFSRDDGTTPTLVNSVNISVVKGNFEEIRQWLIDTEGDDSDYLETVVSKPAVLALVKKKLKAGDDVTDLPDYLKASSRPSLRVTGWKGASGETESEDG
jgi:hypothetical protein